MSTRGLIGFRVDGEFNGTYNHSDSYPDGLGKDVVEWIGKNLTSKKSLDDFKAKIKEVSWVKEDSQPTPDLVAKYRKFSNTNVGKQTETDWYCLLREVQGTDCLDPLKSGELGHLINYKDFIKESLFCEYAYVLDLDRNVLEFYRGFQKEPDEKNPFGQENSDGYYPCKKVGECPIEKILADWKKKFYKEEEN